MKTTAIFLLSVVLSLGILLTNGQNIELRFTGQETNSQIPVSLDSVLIKNLTRGCDTTLYGNNPSLILFPTGIENPDLVQQSFDLIQNYPNPFQERTNFGLKVLSKERICIQVFTLLGQKVTEYEGDFNPGMHMFSFIGTQNGFYLLTASNGKTVKSLKLISTKLPNGFMAKLTYVTYSTDESVYKKSPISEEFIFRYGDQLEYTGYSFGYMNCVISDSPQTSMNYTFDFDFPYSFSCGDSLVDERDGKVYETILIGSQCWISENLNIGEKIDGQLDQQDNATVEKYCYDNNDENCEIYGGLYQWDEMMQYDTNRANQGICPKGWRLPSEIEWDTLINFLGGEAVAGEVLKQGGTSGFEALFGGKRDANGTFSQLGTSAFLSSALQTDDQAARNRYLITGDPAIYKESTAKTNGYSVRCIKGYPNRLNPLVVVIDSNVYRLLSDSLELAQGIYRYEILQQQQQDTIGQNNFIIGLTGEGYLREVTEANQTGNFLNLSTEQASLTDIWESGEFNLSLDENDLRGNYLYSVTNYLAEGVSIKDTEDGGLVYTFEDVTLFEEGAVKISLPSGDVKINLNFDNIIMIYTPWNGLEYFHIRDNDATYEASTKLQLALSAELEQELFEKDLVSRSRYYYIPPIFVVVLTIKLKVKDVISAGITWTATTGYTQKKQFDLGFKYQNNTWGKIWNYQTLLDSVHPIEYNLMVNFANKLSLIPEMTFKLYGVVGPYCYLDFYKKYEAKLSLFDPHCWDMAINLGLGGEQAIDPSILDEEEDIQVWSLGPFEATIWNFPDSIIYIKGNNQTGEPGETLNDSLVVQVVDNFGYGWPFIPVEYTIKAGDGSLSDAVARTNDLGYAGITWTLGPNAGQNKVNAQVRKADLLSHVKNSPFEFEATATEEPNWVPCPGIPTVTYEGQTYNTVLIGNQCWFKENLNVGTKINSNTGGSLQTDNGIIEKYCYNNDESQCDIYGGLYEWNEAMQYHYRTGSKGICPDGWHISWEGDWDTLQALYSYDHVGFAIKSTGTIEEGTGLWHEPNPASNVHGFTALPAGARLREDGTYGLIGYNAKIWSSNSTNPFNNNNATYYGAAWAGKLLIREVDRVDFGFSVRCIQDYGPGGNGGEPCPGLSTITYEGQTYNTVLIGNQCWLKENLNVGLKLNGWDEKQSDNGIIEKYCYDDDENNCDIYGGLYIWDEAMQYTTTPGAKGVCPDGWHIPTDDDFKILEGNVDSFYPVGHDIWDNYYDWNGFDVGYHLKSSTGWDSSLNGDDSYCFTALPSGKRSPGGFSGNMYFNTYFWSSDWSIMHLWYFEREKIQRLEGNGSNNSSYSVRCLKDD